MNWGEWMVPRLTLSAEAQLRSHVAALEQEGPANVDQLVRVASSLAQQNALQAAIIRQATGHIALLEMSIELSRCQRPGPIKRLLNLFGFQ